MRMEPLPKPFGVAARAFRSPVARERCADAPSKVRPSMTPESIEAGAAPTFHWHINGLPRPVRMPRGAALDLSGDRRAMDTTTQPRKRRTRLVMLGLAAIGTLSMAAGS